MKPSYKTVARSASATMIERKSKFIATVRPVKTESQALELIAEMKSKYYDATHNVYAYIIGEGNIMRYSDDGEPSGTAGVPVLEVMRKEGLIDTAVVVTRYFGGILLGAGGLVRAYGASAKLGLDEAKIVTRTLCDLVEVSCDYTLFGKVQYETLGAGYIISDIVYESDVRVYVYTKIDKTDEYIKLMCDITNAKVQTKKVAQEYIDL
ncbi:MAG: YigZ family protein [Ruminococcaceae bacterium]|nr:YigZ family protein [Oscillospiraceae bacterium]